MSFRFEAALVVVGLACWPGCQREKRDFRAAPADRVVFSAAARQSEIQPGGPLTEPEVTNPYNGNAYAISEGQRLYKWYNCSGCHFNGGGGIGPPFLDHDWIYGGAPANIFDTIVKGRPNGMPSWAGKIPEYQIWQIVAYVRSLSGDQPRAATPARSDQLEKSGATSLRQKREGATR